jgi:hypothetical protein
MFLDYIQMPPADVVTLEAETIYEILIVSLSVRENKPIMNNIWS